jgi:hypothetical protein
MPLVCIGIDPATNGLNCPAVFVDPDTGDLLLQGGVVFRRARVVSEPLADFIRYEHEMTGPLNIAAGEQVRWLPRRRASDLALPGNDCWVLDGKIVRFGFFAGDGEFTGEEIASDPAVARFCAEAFEAVWDRAIDHQHYQPAR